MDHAGPVCELCGAPCRADERRPRELIEQQRRDPAAGIAAGPQATRGRPRWFAPARRDPAVLATTPRYRIVRRTYQLCPACDAAVSAGQARSASVQRRGAAAVAGTALALAAALLALRWIWPGAYAALGLEHPGPYQPYVKIYVPPSSTPYRPPFDPSTPAEGGR